MFVNLKYIKGTMILLGAMFIQVVYCQVKYSSNWLFGYDTMNLHTQFNFNDDSLKVSTFKSVMYIDGVTVISNSVGKLLFYTDGCQIFNSNHQLILNGDNLTPINWGSFCTNGIGILLDQSALAIPIEGKHERFILISPNLDTINVNGTRNVGRSAFYYHIIDFDSIHPNGIVSSKTNILLNGIFGINGITMCKHGNGLDWWILFPHLDSNCISVFKLVSDEFKFSSKICFELPYAFKSGSGSSKFSSDGNYFAISDNYEGISLFRFNRCKGTLSFLENIRFPEDTVSGSYCEISPNSQFLYVFNRSRCWQIDLFESNRSSSKTVVAEWDKMIPNTRFGGAQLALDNRIYVACPGTSNFYHVIKDPNTKGTLCNFEQRAIKLPTYNFYTIPNFPNYNLKAESVPCEMTNVIEQTTINCDTRLISLKGNKYILDLRDMPKGKREIAVYDVSGSQLQLNKNIYYSDYELDFSNYKNGIYFIVIKSDKLGVCNYKITKID
ncbi:MAG: hypothetical protein IPM34_06555 [Saprospiraceae bacterium]|nr:hypothetical protein [Saprospiraceae bacterium]